MGKINIICFLLVSIFACSFVHQRFLTFPKFFEHHTLGLALDSPIQTRDARGDQPGELACQTWLLSRFYSADRVILKSYILSYVLKDIADHFCRFFGNDCTGNWVVGATNQFLKEALVLRIILDGMDGSVREDNFEILIAIFTGTMTNRAVRVLNRRDDTTIVYEVFV